MFNYPASRWEHDRLQRLNSWIEYLPDKINIYTPNFYWLKFNLLFRLLLFAHRLCSIWIWKKWKKTSKKKKPKIKELKIFFFFFSFFQNGNEIRSKRKRERGGRKGSERNKWNQKEIDSVYYIFHHCDLSTRLNVNWSAQQFDKCAFIYLVFVSLQTDIQPIKHSMFTFIDVCASASIKNWSNSPLFSRSKFMSNLWISNHQLEPMTKWWNFSSL